MSSIPPPTHTHFLIITFCLPFSVSPNPIPKKKISDIAVASASGNTLKGTKKRRRKRERKQRTKRRDEEMVSHNRLDIFRERVDNAAGDVREALMKLSQPFQVRFTFKRYHQYCCFGQFRSEFCSCCCLNLTVNRYF